MPVVPQPISGAATGVSGGWYGGGGGGDQLCGAGGGDQLCGEGGGGGGVTGNSTPCRTSPW